MGETSVYYVPEDQARWVGREREAAEAFWDRGVFVVTPDRFIYDRIREWQAEGRTLPEWNHSFGFAEMGFGGLGEWEPVPNVVYDLRCPKCDADVADALHELWEAESGIPLPDRAITCASCGAAVPSAAARSETPFTFARFFLWIADVGDDWDPRFQDTVEDVLGPCSQFRAWET